MYDLDLGEVIFKDQYFNRSDIENEEYHGMYDCDLGEVLFKDQYLSRSDMSRMRNSMVCMTLTLGRCYLKINTSVGVT